MSVFHNVRTALPISAPPPRTLTQLPHGNTGAPYPALSSVRHAAMVTHGHSPAPGLAPFWQQRQIHGTPSTGVWSLGHEAEMGFGRQR